MGILPREKVNRKKQIIRTDGDYENTQFYDKKEVFRHDSVGRKNGGISGDQAVLLDTAY
jgi:hypothetical protein